MGRSRERCSKCRGQLSPLYFTPVLKERKTFRRAGLANPDYNEKEHSIHFATLDLFYCEHCKTVLVPSRAYSGDLVTLERPT